MKHRIHLSALVCSSLAGVPAALLGALVYASAGGGFLSGMLAVLVTASLSMAALWIMELIRPRLAPAANPQVIAALLLCGTLITSVAAGLFNLSSATFLSGRRALVIMVDKSGSMNGESDRRCHEALTSLLDSLPPSQELILGSFHATPSLYSRTPVRNTPQNRQLLLAWLANTLPNGGSTNAAAAIDAAILVSPDSATLLMITDARVGSTVFIQQEDQLRQKRMVFSCLHIGDDQMSSVLQQLAEGTGGVYSQTAGVQMLDTLLFRSISGSDGNLLAPVEAFSALRLVKLCVLALMLALTYLSAFGLSPRLIPQLLFGPLLAAGAYLLAWGIPELPAGDFPPAGMLPAALLLLSLNPVLCLFRTGGDRHTRQTHPF